jgi:hypothetical protein
MTQRLAPAELSVVLLKAMKHRSPAPVCSRCTHFVVEDRSGSMAAMPSHCTLNPAAFVQVSGGDTCDHHCQKSG